MDGHHSHDYSYKQYHRRWRMLGIIFLFNLFIQIIFITFAPIAGASADYFGVDTTAINWLALVWSAVFVPCTVLAAWGFSKYGLRMCIITSAVVMLLGCCVRLIALAFHDDGSSAPNDDASNSAGGYTFVLLGTILIAVVQPFVLSSTTLVASAWFSEKQRNLANTLMAIANPLGLALGSLLSPSLVVSGDASGIRSLLGIQTLFAFITLLATLFLVSDPPSAPSATAGSARRRPSELVPELKALRGNFGYITLCNVFSLAVGALTALLTLMEQVLASAGYTEDDAGRFSAILILCGILGCAVIAPILDRLRCYKLVVAGALTLALPFFICFTYFSQRPGNTNLLTFFAVAVGFFGFPMLPAALDMSAEVAYPASAGLTSALLWCGSQVTTLVLVILVDGPLREPDQGVDGAASLEPGSWLLVGCMMASAILAWMWSGRYIRKEMEETVTRLRQAQRRDTGLPFVDVIGGTRQSPQPTLSRDIAGHVIGVTDVGPEPWDERDSSAALMGMPENVGDVANDQVELTPVTPRLKGLNGSEDVMEC